MYSSGTTGLPKCMVHGAGGTLLQHLKEHALHTDLRARRPHLLLHDVRLDDVELARVRPRRSARRSCCTTARRSRRDRTILWDLADAERSRCSARAPSSSRSPRRRGSCRAQTHDLSRAAHHPVHRKPARRAQLRLRLREVKARRPPQQHQRRHRHHLAASRLAIPTRPVYRGEMQMRGSAWRWTCSTSDGTAAFAGAAGRARVHGAVPEHAGARSGTTPTAPKYRAAYFEHYPGRRGGTATGRS